MAATVQTIDYFATGDGNHASSDTLPSVTRGVYNRSLLKRAQPELVHQQFGMQHPLGMRKGQSMVFRRYEKLDQATIPLSEGVTPDGTSLVKRDYVATIKQYGNYVIVSDFVDMTHVDPIIQQSVELMGENMGETMDSVYREYLVTGTSVAYAGTGNSAVGDIATGDVLTSTLFDTVISALKGADAKVFQPQISGSTRVNNYPVAKSFWAIIHTDLEGSFYNTTNFPVSGMNKFVPVEQYANADGVMENEIGKYRQIRFITSTNAKVYSGQGTGAIDVYGVLVFARDAYGVVPLQRGSARTIIQRAGGNTDPLEQRNTVGWKSAGCAIILNDDWMYRVVAAAA